MAHPPIDPVAFHVGPVAVHWYGIMYLVGFAGAWWLGRVRARDPRRGWDPAEIDDLIFHGALGVILGGRLGYALFYKLPDYLHDPGSLLRVWEGGMSFHGGLIGVLVALWLYGRKTRRGFFAVSDFVAPLVPIGLGAGRIGNFINGELWGKASSLPWAMVFPDPRAGGVPRHPSQLYEALLEGLALFVALWLYSGRPRAPMAVSGAFLGLYGLFRFGVEFVRLPDAHLGYLAFGWLTLGQALTVPMMLAGVVLLALSRRHADGARRSSQRAPPSR